MSLWIHVQSECSKFQASQSLTIGHHSEVGLKKKKKGSKGVKFSDESVLLCFEGHDYYALRNEAKLPVWMEF